MFLVSLWLVGIIISLESVSWLALCFCHNTRMLLAEVAVYLLLLPLTRLSPLVIKKQHSAHQAADQWAAEYRQAQTGCTHTTYSRGIWTSLHALLPLLLLLLLLLLLTLLLLTLLTINSSTTVTPNPTAVITATGTTCTTAAVATSATQPD